MRGVADPKRHYKRQDAPSEFAALGTVVAGKFDGASGTLKKRERKTGLMGELLADEIVTGTPSPLLADFRFHRFVDTAALEPIATGAWSPVGED